MNVKVNSDPSIQGIKIYGAFELAVLDAIGLGSKKLDHAQRYVSLSCEFHVDVRLLVVKNNVTVI